jgi:hypothetical protein
MWQVLNRYPDLVSIVLLELWAKKYSNFVNNTLFEHGQQEWTLRLLMPIFRTLIRQNRVPLKPCFLIDGLDEFDGDQEEIANFFKEITEAGDVKVCLSSRPWVVVAESFKDDPFLRLQDLSRPDIAKYVYGNLVSTNHSTNLHRERPKLRLHSFVRLLTAPMVSSYEFVL